MQSRYIWRAHMGFFSVVLIGWLCKRSWITSLAPGFASCLRRWSQIPNLRPHPCQTRLTFPREIYKIAENPRQQIPGQVLVPGSPSKPFFTHSPCTLASLLAKHSSTMVTFWTVQAWNVYNLNLCIIMASCTFVRRWRPVYTGHGIGIPNELSWRTDELLCISMVICLPNSSWMNGMASGNGCFEHSNVILELRCTLTLMSIDSLSGSAWE